MDFGLQVVSSACRCESESTKEPQDWRCTRSVVENRAKKGSRLSFTTRTLTAKKENLNKWNLGVFAQPRHPLFDGGRKVQEMRTEFLNIDFASVENRVEFRRKFDKALKLRNAAEAKYRQIIRDTEYLSEKNERPALVSPRGPPQAVLDRPPIIRPISPVSIFGINHSGIEEDRTKTCALSFLSQNARDPFRSKAIIPGFSDSGNASAPYNTLEQPFSDPMMNTSVDDRGTGLNSDDNAESYLTIDKSRGINSNVINTSISVQDKYVTEFVNDLVKNISAGPARDEFAINYLCATLPGLLMAFARNSGHLERSKESREVMVFVSKHKK